MKAWVVVQDGPNSAGWVGNVFHTEFSAMRWADASGYKDNMRVVEIEIPDPPHEWKVGDWFMCEGWTFPARIVDIGERYFAFHYRDVYGDPTADVDDVSELSDATPCDPPEWWEGDR